MIGGATASGKTSLAIDVARALGTEIISADSRQFYREMRVGNARPEPEELAAVPHHFVADRSVTDPLSAGRFAAEALVVLDALFYQHERVVVVGGGGLYLRALAEGLDEFPDVTDTARAQVQNLVEKQGLTGLQAELRRLDPAYFAAVDQANPRRLERALLVSYSSGRPYSSFLNKRPPRPFAVRYFRTARPRPELYGRINRRVDLMLQRGLEAEARALYPHRALPALQTVGYQEWWPYFENAYDRDRAVELIKRNSRRYAKRQETWFGKDELYVPVTTAADLLQQL